MGGLSQLLSQAWPEGFREASAVGTNFYDWTVHVILVSRVYLKTRR